MSGPTDEFSAYLWERACRADSQLEFWQGRAEELKERLEAVVDDPLILLRAVNGERMLLELYGWLRENPSVGELLPTGFTQRLEAQILFNRYRG